MKRPKHGATLKQYAFAQKMMNADGPSKHAIALSVGYSPSVAKNTSVNIEESEGYKNALIDLAHKSGNLVMAAMAEYEARGFSKFSNKDLNGAMNAIAGAWERIAKHRKNPQDKNDEGNPLKAIFQKRIETQTVLVPSVDATASEMPSQDAIDDEDEL